VKKLAISQSLDQDFTKGPPEHKPLDCDVQFTYIPYMYVYLFVYLALSPDLVSFCVS
jgi:hypothetical protein